MNVLVIRAELEDERTWRLDEIRFLRNQLSNLTTETAKDQFRRALVVMLYAHYEGFCKFALLQYVKAVNSIGLTCSEALPSIVACSWEKIFSGLENPSKKDAMFNKLLPDDTKLHRLSRRKDFVEEYRAFENQNVSIEEVAIDTESNLSPIVLKKNLFKLGLDPNVFSDHDGEILQLLRRRNNISHGAERSGLNENSYNIIEKSVVSIMDDIMLLVTNSLSNESFRR